MTLEAPGRPVRALLLLPPDARLVLVLAHGAGAGMEHAFLEAIAGALAERGIGTLRFQFPYTDAGKRRPDPPAVLEGTVRAAVDVAGKLGLPLIAGGKSMGGRMTSQAQSAAALPGVRGLVFLGFPLHPPKKPAVKRGEHLAGVHVPTLFLQGTRDDLASLDLLQPIVARMPGATLHILEGADHSFHVLKRSGRTDAQVLAELADAIAQWSSAIA